MNVTKNGHEMTMHPAFGCVDDRTRRNIEEEQDKDNNYVGREKRSPASDDCIDTSLAARICPSTVKETESRKNTGRNGRKGNVRYKSSAYIQNLAEISYDILHDSRWRISNKRLFQWERGDDMCSLIYLSRLFLEKEPVESPSPDAAHIDDDDDDDDETFGRCMKLYSRLFHRKGPWFQIQDVFHRYYHTRDDNNQKLNHEQTDQDSTIFKEKRVETLEELKSSIARCIEDLCRLSKMGLIRTFQSEEECGFIIGEPGSKLLIEKDKMNLLGKVGGKADDVKNRLCKTENVILKQIKSQKSIIFHQKQKVLPIKRHVDDMILSKLVDLSMTQCKNDHLTMECLEALWRSVASHLNLDFDLFTCFRLREGPLLTLRRACRLYLCAGDGPGSMRFTGANAWIVVHETKENLVVRHQQQRALLKGVCNLPEPPTVSLWHQVEFHGLKHRMGLSHYSFIENYSRVKSTYVERHLNEKNTRNWIQVFRSHSDFHLWEFCAEIRCVLDYLIEWNRMILYADRKLSPKSKDMAMRHNLQPCMEEPFCILCVEVRASFLQNMLTLCGFDVIDISLVQKKIETIIQNCLHKPSLSNESRTEASTIDIFQTDAERVIAVFGIICHQVLFHRLQKVSHEEMESLLKRPWLRHLHPESVLAYIVWDCIDIIERRGFYCLAINMLETILFGFCTVDETVEFQKFIHGTIERPMVSHFDQLLLSRRVRGKALERLLIDKKHATRQQFRGSTYRNKKRKVCNELDEFTTQCIRSVTSVASIPFSFIRKFCRRIKLPILRLFGDIWSIEMLELGIRLYQTITNEKSTMVQEEWAPKTDLSIANALLCDKNKSGKRCSFVSSEESDGINYTRSLNVEELAMEEYVAGRLPKEETDEIHQRHLGQWTGWHCEGVHVRVLFRLLCHSLLRSTYLDEQQEAHLEQLTVFLNSYQAAPLDLHVAHAALAKDVNDNVSKTYIRGFYERRRKEIDCFLRCLEQISPQEVSDLVFDSVLAGVEGVKSLGNKFTKDLSLYKDYQQVRTLSMLAAGFGGKLLASMFRSLCFDYRHYGAGLPDLLLVRALAHNSTKAHDEKESSNIIDLSEWIGEVFHSSDSSHVGLLYDADDEFLGASLNERQAKSSKTSPKELDKDLEDYVPQRLILSYNGCPVTVECMFVEVKSHNDKLDGRQEDWLNIIDNHGHARLCKFQSTTIKARKSL